MCEAGVRFYCILTECKIKKELPVLGNSYIRFNVSAL